MLPNAYSELNHVANTKRAHSEKWSYYAIMDDIDIYRSAKLMIDRYGEDATLEASLFHTLPCRFSIDLVQLGFLHGRIISIPPMKEARKNLDNFARGVPDYRPPPLPESTPAPSFLMDRFECLTDQSVGLQWMQLPAAQKALFSWNR